VKEVAHYGRVSTSKQKDSLTIENQKKELERYSRENNHTVYRSYYDNGVSGAMPLDERPMGSQMIKDAADGKFSEIIVLKGDRFGRDAADSLYIAKKLKKYNVGIKAVHENIEDKFIFGIHMLVAEKEREDIAFRSSLGKERALDEGRWIGGLAPYGYILDRDTKKLRLFAEKKINGEYSEVEIIRRIYDLCAVSRKSCEKIADALNREKIPPVTPGKYNARREKAKYWIGPRVRNLIKDETYKGEKIFGKRSKNKGLRKVVRVDPIVGKDIWERAQEVLQSNLIQSLRNSKRQYLLTSKISCRNCGRNFTGLAYRGITYYACNNYRLKNNSNPKKCFNKAIRADVLENEVWDDLKNFIDNPIKIKDFLRQKLSGTTWDEISKELKAIDYQVEKIKKERGRLIDFIKAGDTYLVKDIKVEIEKMKNDELKMAEKRKHFEELSRKEEFEKRKILEIEKVFNLFTDKIKNPDFMLKKAIINIMVGKIIVHQQEDYGNKRIVEIQYNFKAEGSVITKSLSTGLLLEK